MSDLYGEQWEQVFLVSALITWGVGLAPPLLMRFVFMCRPIGKAWAVGMTGFFWMCNIALFSALGSQSKSHNALNFVAFVSYAILRKGAKKVAATTDVGLTSRLATASLPMPSRNDKSLGDIVPLSTSPQTAADFQVLKTPTMAPNRDVTQPFGNASGFVYGVVAIFVLTLGVVIGVSLGGKRDSLRDENTQEAQKYAAEQAAQKRAKFAADWGEEIAVMRDEVEQEKARAEALSGAVEPVSASWQAPVLPGPLMPKELFKRTSPAVVRVNVRNARNKVFGIGSGFFVRDDATVVTNFHVIDCASSAEIVLEDGTQLPVLGISGFDEKSDVAVLKVSREPKKGIRPLILGSDQLPPKGTKVYAIGAPEGLDNSLSDGLVSGHRGIDGRKWIQITAPISPGSSGSPVLDEAGLVIGVATMSHADGQNLNFACPAAAVTLLLVENPPLQKLSRFVDEKKGILNVQRERLKKGGDQAKDSTSKMLDELPKSYQKLPEFWLLTGELFERRGPLLAAIEAFRKALTIDDDDSTIWAKIGSVHASIGSRKWQDNQVAKSHCDEAEKAYRNGLKVNSKDAECWRKLGVLLVDLKRPKEAEAALRRCLAINDKDASAHETLGEALAQLGEVESGIAEWQTALKLSEANSDKVWGQFDLVRYGEFLARFGRHKEAVNAFEKAKTIATSTDSFNEFNIQSGLAESHEELHDFPAAIRAHENVLKMISTDPWLNSLTNKSTVQTAIARLRAHTSASQMKPESESPDSTTPMDDDDGLKEAERHIASGLMRRALQSLDAVPAQNWGPRYWRTRAFALFSVANYPGSALHYRKSLDLDGADSDTWIRYATAMRLDSLNNKDAILAACRTALKIDPNDARAYHIMGVTFLENVEAIDALKTALSLDERNLGIHFHLGCNLAGKREGEARKHFKRALDLIGTAAEFQALAPKRSAGDTGDRTIDAYSQNGSLETFLRLQLAAVSENDETIAICRDVLKSEPKNRVAMSMIGLGTRGLGLKRKDAALIKTGDALFEEAGGVTTYLKAVSLSAGTTGLLIFRLDANSKHHKTRTDAGSEDIVGVASEFPLLPRKQRPALSPAR